MSFTPQNFVQYSTFGEVLYICTCNLLLFGHLLLPTSDIGRIDVVQQQRRAVVESIVVLHFVEIHVYVLEFFIKNIYVVTFK